jgi:hypothetical protein
MTLTPINSIRLPNGIYSSTITMWTPNYVLDLDYFGNTGNLLNVMFLTSNSTEPGWLNELGSWITYQLTNTEWVRKLQKRVHSTRSRK